MREVRGEGRERGRGGQREGGREDEELRERRGGEGDLGSRIRKKQREKGSERARGEGKRIM
jgi:hypothetical protein